MTEIKEHLLVLFFCKENIIWRLGFVLIENEVDVKLKLDNLVLNTSEGEIWIPINDISIVVLDNLMNYRYQPDYFVL